MRTHVIRPKNLQRDTQDALYIAREGVYPGFVVKKRGEMITLTPTIETAEVFSDWANAECYSNATHDLRELYDHSRLITSGGDSALFCEGVKLFEVRGDMTAYEKRVRQALSLALRTNGGGRWAAACVGVLLTAD